MAKTFRPYENESDAVTIGDLYVENRVDRVTIHGDVDLTRDKDGLSAARALKRILDGVVAALEGKDLPDKVATEKPETVRNPFE